MFNVDITSLSNDSLTEVHRRARMALLSCNYEKFGTYLSTEQALLHAKHEMQKRGLLTGGLPSCQGGNQ
jgi:hypothetical protein